MRATTSDAIMLIYITTHDKNNNTAKKPHQQTNTNPPNNKPTKPNVVFSFFWEGVYAANALIRKNPVSGKSEQRNRDFLKVNPAGSVWGPWSHSSRGYEVFFKIYFLFKIFNTFFNRCLHPIPGPALSEQCTHLAALPQAWRAGRLRRGGTLPNPPLFPSKIPTFPPFESRSSSPPAPWRTGSARRSPG